MPVYVYSISGRNKKRGAFVTDLERTVTTYAAHDSDGLRDWTAHYGRPDSVVRVRGEWTTDTARAHAEAVRAGTVPASRLAAQLQPVG